MPSRPFLIGAVLMIAGGSSAFAESPESPRRAERSSTDEDAEASAPGQGMFAGGRTGWAVEAFARPAWGQVHATSDDSIGVVIGADSITESVRGSGSSLILGGGAGARLTRGRFGVEAAWQRLRSAELTPFSITADAPALDELTDADVRFAVGDDEARADLFLGQVFYRTAADGQRVSIFVGAGVGFVRVDDPVTAQIQAGDFLDAVPAEFRLLAEPEVVADQSALVFGGSLGLSIRAGRVFLRPRLDAFFGRSLTVTHQFRFGQDFLPSDFPSDQVPVLDLESSITPRFIFLGVDIGFTTG